MRTRFLVLSLVLVACAGSPDATECKSGITCPPETKCAAAQAICITNDCGDGVTQSTEACDDGNIIDGDGCAGNCGSREACGDGVLNAAAGELCDDNNTTGGDGCAADCLSVEICGNGIRDVNEVCDDGGTIPGDGCSGNCLSNEVCGNGIKDINEKCDDGGDPGGCNPDCQGGTGCGDGAIDRDIDGTPLEECDDGNDDNFDDCTDDCHLNACGDGIVQSSGSRTEQCDGTGIGTTIGTGGETASCNIDCTTTSCGDSKINNTALEECDDGTIATVNQNADDRDCTASCKINVCGDMKINLNGPTAAKIEQCDDGNTVPNDACSNSCKTAACGNGVIEMGEACDDFNTNNGDGCNSSCQFERCGDGRINDLEQCDGTGTSTVTGTPGETATCNVNCTTRSCGDGIVNKAAGEECDDMNMVDSGPGDLCRNTTCKKNFCGDGAPGGSELCDDGDGINTNACNNSCTTQTCMDGILQGTEVCDDGNNSNLDGCLNTCVLPTCGDGFIRTTVEQCDNGLTTGNSNTQNCTATCQNARCGDGLIDMEDLGSGDTDEVCDDGNQATETECAYGIASCNICRDDCQQSIAETGNVCGDNVSASPETCDDGNAITETQCPYGDADGMCDICNNTCSALVAETGPRCGDNTTDASFETCDDGSTTCGRCNSTCSASSAAAAASGLIVCSDSGSDLNDTDFITLNDGEVSVKFEFDSNAALSDATAVAVDISTMGTLSADVVCSRLAAAIDTARSTKTLDIDTSNAGFSGLVVFNTRSSSIGNQPIVRDTDLGAGFYTSPAMTGGAAGDCAVGVACDHDEDCKAADGTGFGNCDTGGGTPTFTCQ